MTAVGTHVEPRRAGELPPRARRRTTTAAGALREEISDSWWLLVISLGALCAVAGLLVLAATALG